MTYAIVPKLYQLLAGVAALTVVNAVVDLNRQEIQYVADHLTHAKCMKLLEALHEKGFFIRSQLGEKPSPLPDRQDSERPCVIHLTRWCDGPGKKMTFDYLALRLREIGLKKVADTLSRKVYGETSNKLHRYFLDDPFKKMIPTKSVIIDKQPPTEKLVADQGESPEENNTLDKLFITVVILGTVLGTLGFCAGICLGCPKAGRFVCHRACPGICAEIFDVGLDNCRRITDNAKKTADKHLFKSQTGSDGGALLL